MADGDAALRPIGEALVVRPVSALTVITYGFMRAVSLDAAGILARETIDGERSELRTLRPLDV